MQNILSAKLLNNNYDNMSFSNSQMSLGRRKLKLRQVKEFLRIAPFVNSKAEI